MDDNRQEQDLTRIEENKKTDSTTDRKSRHTWIGDKDEIRPDWGERTVSRATITGETSRGTAIVKTRIAERERRPYRGFITDDEIKHAEAAAEIDRRARAESRAAAEKMAQTRVYSGFGSGLDDETPVPAEKPVRKPRTSRSYIIHITDDRKFKRLIAALAVFVLLLLFEISFFVMRAQTASLPGKTAEVKTQTEKINGQNEELKSETEKLGDPQQIEENKDSWQKIKDQLAPSE